MIKKPQVESSIITKVAIGKPGGADISDEWETFTSLKCLICNLSLNPNPEADSLIHSILQSNSAMFQSSVEAWENDLRGCEHTLTLQQSANLIAAKSLASCGQCDLKSNLWLCMSCGQLGCGRQNYDGSGGNGHALAHHTSTGHPLVCKLGTITPEGSASIHCYTCDEEVLDADLTQHLANFGIQVGSMVKTEKSVAEMELEMNLNLTLSKAVEEGRVLIPRFGPGYTGMENLGNSCYINSVVQTLMAIPEWEARFNNPGWLETKEAATSFYAQFAKLAIALASGRHSSQKWTAPLELEPGRFTEPQQYQDGVRPAMFKAVVGKGHPEFSSPHQQDALEYFQHVVTLTERAEKASGQAGSSPTSVFEFQLRTKIKCLQCQKIRFNDATQNSISTTIPIDHTEDGPELVVPWQKLLSSFSDPEFVEFNCPQCGCTTPASKSNHFKSFPKVLVLVVNRFVCPDWVPKKLQCAVEIPTSPISLMSFAFVDGGEELLPEDSSAPAEPELNQAYLYQLLDMGITETQAKHGLLKTNNVSVEAAATWVFENLDNPELSQPIVKQSNADVDSITGMGFTAAQAKVALGKCDGNPDRASDYLFSHQGEMEVEEKIGEEVGNAEYQLFSVITHLGTSMHSGHYVAHIMKGGECVLFNDIKVAATSDPPLGKGYIYFFRKIS